MYNTLCTICYVYNNIIIKNSFIIEISDSKHLVLD